MLMTDVLLTALLATALPLQTQEKFDFAKVDGNTITIDFDQTEGTPLSDFSRFAQTIVDVPLDFDERDMTGSLLSTHGSKVLNKAEFWHYFQAVLKSRDFVVVPYGNVLTPNRPSSGPDTGFFALRRSSGGAGGGARPGYIKSMAPVVTVEQLESFKYDPGIVLTTSFALKHVNVQEAANMLQTYFTDPMLESVRAVTNSNSLVATGFAQTLFGIHELLRLVDVGPDQGTQELKRIALKHAVADEIRPIVINMIAAEHNHATPRGAPANLPASLQESPPTVESDPRTNSLLIMASTSMQERIARIVGQLDLQVGSSGDTIVRSLENAVATDLASTLNEWAHSTGSQDVSVVADAGSNALLITASKERLSALLKLVDKLDVVSRLPAQVDTEDED